jgi:hypothetical protein
VRVHPRVSKSKLPAGGFDFTVKASFEALGLAHPRRAVLIQLLIGCAHFEDIPRIVQAG